MTNSKKHRAHGIVMIADESYLFYGLFLAYSLKGHDPDIQRILILIGCLHRKEQLDNFAENVNLRIIYAEEDPDLSRFSKIMTGKNLLRERHVSTATYFKLSLIPYFKDAFTRIVYLDIDLLLMGDINDLFNIDLQGFPMGAVEDSQHVQLAKRLQIENYFNAGVFVIDLQHFEIENLGSQAQSCLDNKITLKYQDQDVLNKVFSGYWLKMPNEYNLQIGLRYPNKNTTFVSPKVIHFVGPFKPWDVRIGKYHEEWKVRYDSFQKMFPHEIPNVFQRSANFGTEILIYFANTPLTDILPIQFRIRLASILIKRFGGGNYEK